MQQPQRSEDDDGDTYNRWKTINDGSPILTGQSEVGVGPGPERVPAGSKPWIARHIGRVGSTADAAPQPSRHDLKPRQRFTRAVCIHLRRRIVARVSRWGARGAVALRRRSIVAPDPGDVFSDAAA